MFNTSDKTDQETNSNNIQIITTHLPEMRQIIDAIGWPGTYETHAAKCEKCEAASVAKII